jgi:hypothetical protein
MKKYLLLILLSLLAMPVFASFQVKRVLYDYKKIVPAAKQPAVQPARPRKKKKAVITVNKVKKTTVTKINVKKKAPAKKKK